MVRMIWKYTFDTQKQRFDIPYDGEILDVQFQDDAVVMWVDIDNSNALEQRLFYTFGTGEEMPKWCFVYIATYQRGAFVWHVYEYLGEMEEDR